EALGVSLGAARAALGLGTLGGGENAAKEALAVPFQYFLDPADVDDVGAEADDHLDTLARPRSIAARIFFTVCARPSATASPTRKWPMFNSTTCGNEA